MSVGDSLLGAGHAARFSMIPSGSQPCSLSSRRPLPGRFRRSRRQSATKSVPSIPMFCNK